MRQGRAQLEEAGVLAPRCFQGPAESGFGGVTVVGPQSTQDYVLAALDFGRR